MRWRQCDTAMAIVRYDFRIVAIVLSRNHNVAIVLSHFHHNVGHILATTGRVSIDETAPLYPIMPLLLC